MHTPLLIAVAALGIVTALPSAAQFRKPSDAIKYRQSVMTLQGYHLGRVFAMANNRIPFDAKKVAEDTELLNQLTQLPWVAFVEGTDQGNNTRAKPEIWKEKPKFDAASQKLRDDVAKLNAAAKTGNLDQIKAAIDVVDKTCNACHDNFKKDL